MHIIGVGILNLTVVATVDQPVAVHRKSTVEKESMHMGAVVCFKFQKAGSRLYALDTCLHWL